MKLMQQCTKQYVLFYARLFAYHLAGVDKKRQKWGGEEMQMKAFLVHNY